MEVKVRFVTEQLTIGGITGGCLSFCLLFVYFCLLQPMASVCCRMAHPNLMMAIWAVAAMPTADSVCRETKNIAQMVSFAASKWIMIQIKRKVSKLKIKIGNLNTTDAFYQS